jgi:N-acetylglucosaminyldiphosphoundecaprenol N-acetyl-beta-D-mannosaminyltransferase
MRSVVLAGLIFKGNTRQKILNSDSDFIHVITVNSEFIYKSRHDKRLFDLINEETATLDGQIPYKIARWKNRDCEIEKISGSDLIFDVAKFCKENKKKIFLLGGTQKSNFGAVNNLKKDFGVEVDGYSPKFSSYPFSSEVDDIILHKLFEFSPDFLFVGFGAPKQEFWINDKKFFLIKNSINVAVGCGGTFDFVSGNIQRSPRFIQNIGLEGVYRFLKEPKWFRFKRLLLSFLAVYYMLFRK